MSSFVSHLKWQFILLQKNNIISISLVVTLIGGLVLFFLRGVNHLDQVLVSLVLNDPSVIGYFFIALAIYTEIKHQILQAIFVTPVNMHQVLISKTLAISIIGVVCSLGLAIPVRGLDFDLASYTLGSFGICVLSALLGLIMLTFVSEFLKFTMLSVPVFLVFINVPMLQYLGAFDLGMVIYLFPIQGSLDLIDNAISGTSINIYYSVISIIVLIPLFYWVAYRLFARKIVHQ